MHHVRELGQGVSGDAQCLCALLGGVLMGLLEDGVEEVLLGVDVVVETPLVEADTLRDVLDGRSLVATLQKDLRGGVDDVLEARPDLPLLT